MIKGIVVAKHFSQYCTYMRNRKLNPNEYEYFKHDCPDCIRGLKKEIPVLWLEGWSDNKTMTTGDLRELKRRFTTHKEITEGWIYGEGFKF